MSVFDFGGLLGDVFGNASGIADSVGQDLSLAVPFSASIPGGGDGSAFGAAQQASMNLGTFVPGSSVFASQLPSDIFSEIGQSFGSFNPFGSSLPSNEYSGILTSNGSPNVPNIFGSVAAATAPITTGIKNWLPFGSAPPAGAPFGAKPSSGNSGLLLIGAILLVVLLAGGSSNSGSHK